MKIINPPQYSSEIIDDVIKIIKIDKFEKRNGIYYLINGGGVVSYPENGNEKCYEIEDNSFWFQHRNNVIKTVINNYLEKGSIIIDAGGGNGFVSSMLEKNYYNPVLFEPGQEGVLNSKERNIKYIFEGRFNKETANYNSAPCIGLFDVLEHIERDESFLDELSTLLLPGGYLFITVPAYQLLFSGEDEIAGHYRRYNYGEFKKKLMNANLAILYGSYFFWFLPLPIFIFRKVLNQKKNNKKGIHEHIFPSFFGKIVNMILSVELFFIKNNIVIPFGGSLLMLAQRREERKK
jgi:2-polyprenyl-3-methyl-5-hydroxy-6-metoxy-1,4-benzoquinol methylase